MKTTIIHRYLLPYKEGCGPIFRLAVYDTGSKRHDGKDRLAYEFYEKGEPEPLFAGDQFGCSPLHAIDSEETVAAIMGFICLRPGDTDAEYFEDYTDRQMEFADQYAEDLGAYLLSMSAEEEYDE